MHHVLELVIECLELARTLSGEGIDAQPVVLPAGPGHVDLPDVRAHHEVEEPLVDSIEVQVGDGPDDVDGLAFESPKRGPLKWASSSTWSQAVPVQ